VNLFCWSEAVSPLTHAMGTSGNESLVARQPVVTERGVIYVPSLSGNALRHRAIREPGFRWLIERWQLAGKLTLKQLNFLLHAGNMTEGGGRENTRRIADYHRLYPLGKLLGGCLPDQILSGTLNVGFGVLVCEENRATIAAMMPDNWPLEEASLRPAEAFVSGYQYVRSDAAHTAPDLLPAEAEDEPNGKSNQMIFSGQAVTRGAAFVHTLTIQHGDDLTLGALLLSLRLWQAAGGTIGGQAARGHGRLKTHVHLGDNHDEDTLVADYIAHCDTVKDEAIAWLHEVFAPRPAKPEKVAANKGKRAKNTVEPQPSLPMEGEDV